MTPRPEDERARLLEAAVKRGTEAALLEYESQRQGDVEIGWLGLKLKGRGRAVLTVVTIGAILVGIGYHDSRSDDSGRQRAGEHVQLEQRLNEVIYVLTLSQEERERLNLAMPETLRRRQVERNPRP